MTDNEARVIERLVYRAAEIEAYARKLEDAIACHRLKKLGNGVEADLILWAAIKEGMKP